MHKKLLHIAVLLALILSTLALVVVQLPATQSLKAASVLSTINIGGDLRGAAIDFAINRMFVAQYDTNKVVLIDLNTNAVYTTFNAGTNPWDVAANYLTQRVYVSNYGSDNLTVFQTSFDSPPGSVIATIPLGAGAKPIGVTVNPTTNKVYVANSGNNTVTIINGANNTVIKTLGVGTTPAHIFQNSITNMTYVANNGSNSVTVIDNNDNVVATISVGAQPYGIGVNALTNRIYVALKAGAAYQEIDGSTNAIVRTVTLNGSAASAILANPTTNRVYVTVPSVKVAALYDASGNLVQGFTVGDGAEEGAAVHPNLNRVYITQRTGDITVIQDDNIPPTPTATATATATATPPAGATPTPTNTPVPGQPPNIPAGSTVWYFAEGSTAFPFHTWLLLQNPNSTATTAKVTYYRTDGIKVEQDVPLPALSRKSIWVNTVPGVSNTSFSIRVLAPSYILAERAMYFYHDGSDSIGTQTPSTTWYFAEGATAYPFHTWLLLMNPNDNNAKATITFQLDNGTTRTISRSVPANSRVSVFVNQEAGMANAAFAIAVSSDQPLVAERAMYFDEYNGVRHAGHDTLGTSKLSSTWYFAEGYTGSGYDTWVLLQNPQASATTVTVNYLTRNHGVITRNYTMAPTSRLSLWVNKELGFGDDVGFSISATQPVVAERSMYFGKNQGGHNTMGSPVLATDWYLPEGSTSSPYSEYVLILNPNNVEANVKATFYSETGKAVERTLSLAPNSRTTIDVGSVVPNQAVSTRVQSDRGVVVERSMYFQNGNGGTNSIGIIQNNAIINVPVEPQPTPGAGTPTPTPTNTPTPTPTGTLTPTPTNTPTPMPTSGKATVTVVNELDQPLTVNINSYGTLQPIQPGGSTTIQITPGTYSYTATAQGYQVMSGQNTFTANFTYTWRFFKQ